MLNLALSGSIASAINGIAITCAIATLFTTLGIAVRTVIVLTNVLRLASLQMLTSTLFATKWCNTGISACAAVLIAFHKIVAVRDVGGFWLAIIISGFAHILALGVHTLRKLGIGRNTRAALDITASAMIGIDLDIIANLVTLRTGTGHLADCLTRLNANTIFTRLCLHIT